MPVAEATWRDLEAAMEAAATDGPVSFWLRDDDAVAVTPALEALAVVCRDATMPVLLAVIPDGVTGELATWLAREPLFTPCQHGIAHANHAAAGERACELGGARSDEVVLAALRAARVELLGRLGPSTLSDVLVPPWNRIRDSLVPYLPAIGYSALSTFAGARPAAVPSPPADAPGADAASSRPAPSPDHVNQGRCPLPRLDCDLDIIDWRNGRRGRSAGDLCGRLVRLLAETEGTGRPIGLLTHHLAHDEAAWAFLARFLPTFRDDTRVRFVSAEQALAKTMRAGEA